MLRSLASLSNYAGKPVIIVFSHLKWDFVFQRPQQILTRAARDFQVYFIEEPIYEGEVATFIESSRDANITLIQPVLPVGTEPADAVFHQGDVAETIAARAGSAPLYLWYYTPMALEFGHRIACDAVVFDKMDELSAFAFAPPELRALETSLMDTADLVFTGGASLYASAVDRNPQVHCFPSSIDVAHFVRARSGDLGDPADQCGIPYPRLGYFGVIDERINLDMIAQVAALRPDWQLVMIGPTAKIDPESLPRAANIHWLGSKDYADLPAYLAHWDMGWMPFALNDATRFISPTKTPEFLAAGLPLMSTPIHDVVEPYGRLALVEIVTHASEIASCGDRLLEEARQPEAVAARRKAAARHLSGNSWDATWAEMRALLLDAAVPASSPVSSTNAKESARV